MKVKTECIFEGIYRFFGFTVLWLLLLLFVQAPSYTESETLQPIPANVMDADECGILFTFNEQSLTAIVGSNTDMGNGTAIEGSYTNHITIPDSVKKDGKIYKVIGFAKNAFSYTSIESIHLGANISSLDYTAFQGCRDLEKITVSEDSLYFSASEGVLYDKAQTYLYVYPAGKGGKKYSLLPTTKYVGYMAFNDSGPQEIEVPDGVEYISKDAFYSLENLRKITLPFIGERITSNEQLSYLVSGASRSLKTVIITGGSLAPSTFSGFVALEEVYLPDTLKEIPAYCFKDCSKLSRLEFGNSTDDTQNEKGVVHLPEGVSTIRESAFRGCSALEFVVLPNTLKTIEDYAFRDCTMLKRMEIPASVTSIGYAFRGCDSISAFWVDPANPNFCSDRWGVLYDKSMKTLYNYPSSREWPYYNVSDVTERILDSSFVSCKNLVNLYIPNTVSSINQPIFECSGLTIDFTTKSYMKALFRHLRNAVAHFNISFESDCEKRVSHIILFDSEGCMACEKCKEYGGKTWKFYAKIPVIVFHALVLEFSETMEMYIRTQKLKESGDPANDNTGEALRP